MNLQLHDITKGENYVSCAVQKDAGDDPDTTNGILVYAKVEKISAEVAKNIIDNQNTDSKKVIIHSSIILDGGVGVGRVTNLVYLRRWAKLPSTRFRRQ